MGTLTLGTFVAEFLAGKNKRLGGLSRERSGADSPRCYLLGSEIRSGDDE